MKNIIEEELYKLKDDKKTLDFIDNKDCIYYKELDFAITILERILEKIKKTDKRYSRNNEIYRNVDIDIGTKQEAIKYRNVTIELTNNFMKIFNGTRLIFHKIDDIVIFDIKESDKNV